MQLREIQQEDLGKLKSNWDNGINRNLCLAPTGAGKTILLTSIPKLANLPQGKKHLVIAHREELLDQTLAKAKLVNKDLNCTVEQANRRADPNADFIIASIQSIGRAKYDDVSDKWEYSKRLEQWDPESIGSIIVDECHHTRASTYRNVLRWAGALKSHEATYRPDLLSTGMTATSHPKGLDEFYDAIAFERSIRELISLGYLCAPKCFRISTTVSLDHVGKSNGDFSIGELEKTVNTPERNRICYEAYMDHGEGKPFIAFTCDVQHSLDLAQTFNDKGIKAACITGKTPSEDRKRIFQLYREGVVRGLVSCAVLTEGFDEPRATVAILARPTQSYILYVQSLGRVLRPFPSPEDLKAMMDRGEFPPFIKDYSICLDLCDLSTRHRLTNVNALFGLPESFDSKGQKINEVVEKVEKIAQEKKIAPSQFNDLASLESFAQSIDLFSKPTVPDVISQFSSFSWLGGLDSSYFLSLPDYKSLTVKEDALGHFRVMQSVKGIASFLGESKNLKDALRIAEAHIPSDARAMMKADASWRTNPPSEAQLDLIWKRDRSYQSRFSNKNDFAAYMMNNLTRGDCSNLINNLVGRR